MKRLYLFGAIAAMAGGLALASSANAAPQTAAGNSARLLSPNGGTTSITFDGYCDGMTITIPGSAGAPGAQGAHIGSCLGYTANVYGVAGSKGVGFADLGDEQGGAPPLYWVIGANHTWIIYDDCGFGNECVLNSGTWSYGTPDAPAKGGARPSTSPAAGLFGGQRAGFAGARQLPGPKTLFNIHFAGFCDGEYLHVPGDAGSPGADGVQTGSCTSGDALIGAFEGNVGGMWDYTDNFVYVINTDQSWIIYTDCGDGTECYVNSGTWAFGPPSDNPDRTAIRSNLQH
ncbi:MAG: hypothetical protein ACRES7_05120 [Gammaproteobacteria bacterium]